MKQADLLLWLYVSVIVGVFIFTGLHLVADADFLNLGKKFSFLFNLVDYSLDLTGLLSIYILSKTGLGFDIKSVFLMIIIAITILNYVSNIIKTNYENKKDDVEAQKMLFFLDKNADFRRIFLFVASFYMLYKVFLTK